MKFTSVQLNLVFTLIWALVSLTSTIARSLAAPTPAAQPSKSPVNYDPPTGGEAPPKKKKPGSDRPVCPGANKPIAALASKYYVGYTLAERPTFFVFVPYSSTGQYSAKFVLRNEQQVEVYETTFQLNGTPGIVKLSLPENAPALEIDKIYSWSFSFNCGQGMGEDSVKWWVKRVALSDDLNIQLKTATSREKVALYADNGLWHEALNELAELRRSQPLDEAIQADWADLLRDRDVGLDAIVSESIVNCCTLSQ